MNKITKNMLVLSSTLHLAMLCHHALLVSGFVSIELDKFEHPVVVRMKPFKFLTISGWCLKLQMDHIVLSLIVERQHWRGAMGDSKIIGKFGRYKDMLFRGLVLPSTLLVSSLFWLLYFLDRDLIFPPLWDEVVSPRLNHGIHTSTAVFALIELMMRRGGGERGLEARLYWSLAIGYALLTSTVYLFFDFWLYPFLQLLSWSQLCLCLLVFSSIGYIILESVWRLDGVPDTRFKH